MSNYIYNGGELYHYGVKGMKWGHRKARPRSELTDKQIKKYAKKGYAKDAYNSNKTVAGKAYDRFTGAHKINADMKYGMSSKAQNKDRAEQYLRDKEKKNTNKKDTAKKAAVKTVAKGANVATKLLTASVLDDIFYGGAGKKIAKTAVIQTGRAAVTAYTMARGGYDIRWYDN
jgi:hypothetical protein